MDVWEGSVTAQDYVVIIGALVGLCGAISAAAVAIIKALKENTAVTVANTVDRAEKTIATNEKLDTIVGAVTGTGSGVTVVNVPPPEPPRTD